MRILAYVEPHPIRNSHTQFAHAGRLFAQGLLNASREEKLDFRIFANDAVADQLSRENAEVVPWLLRPTEQETATIREYDQTWNEKALEIWLNVVNGRAGITAFYVNLLRRVHGLFPFDVLLLWSENGAARQAARALGATTVHAELGPTRHPFPPTIYLDAIGTNGNASVTRAPLSVVEHTRTVPRETWLTPCARGGDAPHAVMQFGVLWPSPSVASLLPHEPFAFIPLQLADDLNTLCHSTCHSPAEFLEQVIPACLEQGLRPVLKGHPGVAGRPYNLTKERQALAKARAMGAGVVVLPHDLGGDDTLAVVTQAQIVCTVNSSLGFESLLLGKSCALLGAALYDLQGRIRARGLRGVATDEQRGWDTLLVSFLMGHYLLPLQDVLSGEALLAAIRLIRTEHLSRGDFGEAFWGEWVQRMRFGFRDLVQTEPAGEAIRRSPAALGHRWAHVLGGELRCTGEDSVEVCLRLLSSSIVFSALCVARHFTGHVDELTCEESTCRIRGWAFDARHNLPVTALLVTSGENVIVCSPPSISRPDVAEHLHVAAAEHSGFELEFRTDAPRSSLRLFMVSERSVVQEVAWQAGPLPT